MNSSPFFRLQLFGRPLIKVEGGGFLKGAAAQRHRVAVLALLALAEDRGVTRDKIFGYLWPENDTDHARNLLNVAVYALRKSLGEECIASDGEGLRLNARIVGSDVADFSAAVERGDYEAAVTEYSGPFLDGFFIGDAPEFERWVERERGRLGGLYCGAVESLADQAEHARQFERAAELWKSRAAIDPYDSRITIRLMQALDASGNTAAALQHASIHERLLKEEFGVEPSADLKNAIATLRSRRESSELANGASDNVIAHSLPTAKTASAITVQAIEPYDDSRDTVAATRKSDQVQTRRPVASNAAILGFLLIVTVIGVGWFFGVSRGRKPTVPVAVANIGMARAIAVLPFTNMSADAGEEYFSDGLTDELIGVLSHVRTLQVASRTSAFAFKGQKRDIRAIGQMLNVGTVLEGSVRKVGNRVRVTAQLINSADGFHLWSETYEREGTDIFAIQTDLALRIASALEAELTPAERERIARPPTRNAAAHTFYLQGRYFAIQRRRGSLEKAIDYYERAIAADTEYAAAYAGLASVYPPLGVHGYIAPWEGRERMHGPAAKAVALDSGLAEAHTALGGYLYAYEWDWSGAEREYQKAIALDRAEARGWYSVLLLAMHRNNEAVSEARKGAELAPLSALSYSQLGGTLVIAGRPDLALAPLATAIELDSALSHAHLNLAIVYDVLGKRDEALREFQTTVTLVPHDAIERAYLGRALVLAGREREGRDILDSLKVDAAKTHLYVPHVALLLDALGDTDAAITWLTASAQQRHPAFPHGVVEPAFATLRRDSRFRDLLRRSGLP